MTDLNVCPLSYDFNRVRWLPKHIYDCGHCHLPLEVYQKATLVAGNFHHPGKATLLCERCAEAFWEREHLASKAAEEAGY